MDRRKEKIDFLIVGFPKCGTTTLDSILRNHSEVKLPIIKETQFYYMKNCYKKKFEFRIKRYFNNYNRNKKLGLVEPSFFRSAEEIYRDFGKDIKIIFMVRNPIEALFSYFRMNLRYVENAHTLRYYKEFDEKASVSDKFDSYVKNEILQQNHSTFHYSYWIDTFLKYYSEDNIKIVLFEEFVSDRQNTINEILTFLGLSMETLNVQIHENKGNKLSRNLTTAKINHVARQGLTHLRPYPRLFKLYESIIFHPIQKLTIKENKDQMDESTRLLLREYYREEIDLLSKKIDVDLFTKWNI